MSNWLLSQRAPGLLPRDTGGVSVTSPCWEPGLSGVTLTTSIVPSGKWVGTPLSWRDELQARTWYLTLGLSRP